MARFGPPDRRRRRAATAGEALPAYFDFEEDWNDWPGPSEALEGLMIPLRGNAGSAYFNDGRAKRLLRDHFTLAAACLLGGNNDFCSMDLFSGVIEIVLDADTDDDGSIGRGPGVCSSGNVIADWVVAVVQGRVDFVEGYGADPA